MKGKWEILIPIKNVVDEGETSPVVGHVQLRSSECTAITVYDQTCSRPGRDTLAARPASAGSSGGAAAGPPSALAPSPSSMGPTRDSL